MRSSHVLRDGSLNSREEVLDGTFWRICFGRGCGPVGRQTAKCMNDSQIFRHTLGRRLRWLWALSERSDEERNPSPDKNRTSLVQTVSRKLRNEHNLYAGKQSCEKNSLRQDAWQ